MRWRVTRKMLIKKRNIMKLNDYLHNYIGCQIQVFSIGGYDFKGKIETLTPSLYKEIATMFFVGKLILRPLADMTTGEKYKFEPKNEDGEIGQEFIGSESETSYAFVSFMDMARTINQLRALGFDCDGLIEAGLAIDKTQLEAVR